MPENDYRKPLPQPTPETQPYWDGCKQNKLLIQRCRQCGRYQFYPRSVCAGPDCTSDQLEWVESKGRGRVKSYTASYVPGAPGFENELPYVVAIITLEEGVQMLSNVVACPPDAVYCEMPVEVVFEDVTPDITLPKFRPMADGPAGTASR